MEGKKVIAIIPARFQSSRFPGKPLALICGKPMIQWVYERVSAVKRISETFVATDDQRISETVKRFGGRVIMTGNCGCGTERVFQAGKDIEADVILNIQGDEPLIKAKMIEELLCAFDDPSVIMATLKKEISNEEELTNSNVVKVITDKNDNAVYFSRYPVPYNRDQKKDVKYYKHIGIYGYKKNFLKQFVGLPVSDLEKTEQLEQLRAIENGYPIRVLETEFQCIGVDLPENIKQVETMLYDDQEKRKK